MTEAFSVVAVLFNPAGSIYQRVTAWDNGTTHYDYI
jgi:hypothetical protein